MNRTEIIVDDERLELGPDTVVSITKQICDLSNPATRNSDTSNTIQVPKTALNRQRLENADLMNSSTNKPYERLRGEIKVGGLNVIENGIAKLNSTSDVFELVIQSGNIDLFEAIAGLKLGDLDFTSLAHNWDLATILANRTNTTGFNYPVIDFGALSNLNQIFDVRKQLPGVFVRWLIEKIHEEAGFEIDFVNLENNTRLNKAIVPCLSNRLLLDDYKASADIDNQDHDNPSTSPDQIFFPQLNDISDPQNTLSNQALTVLGQTGTTYRVANDGTFVFRVTLTNYVFTGANISTFYIASVPNAASVAISVGNYYVFTNGGESGDELVLETPPLSLVEGTLVFTYFAIVLGCELTYDNLKFEVLRAEMPYVNFGNEFPLADNMPDMEQGTFLKAIMNKFYILPTTNNNTKVVKWRQLDEVSIANARNWSDKVHITEEATLEYRFGNFAQANFLKYKEDTTVEKTLGNGVITIDDENLEVERDLIVSPFAATEMVVRLDGLDVPIIEVYDTATGKFSKKVQPRILICEIDDAPGLSPQSQLDYTDGTTTNSITTNIPFAYFHLPEKADSLHWEVLRADNMETLEGMLLKTKMVKLAMRLTEKDINELDHFIAVQLSISARQFSANGFFYVNKIENWIENELTIVQLIRL